MKIKGGLLCALICGIQNRSSPGSNPIGCFSKLGTPGDPGVLKKTKRVASIGWENVYPRKWPKVDIGAAK